MLHTLRIPCLARIVFLLALAPASFGAIVSFEEHPIAITSNPGALSVKVMESRDPEFATSERFAEVIGGELRSCPGPSLVIAEPTPTFVIRESVRGERTWEQVLLSYADAEIPCTLSMDGGFLQASYGKEPGTVLKASLAEGIVPPLAIVADDGPQILAVWATASGLTISYDEAAMEREKARAIDATARERKSLKQGLLTFEPSELEEEILWRRPSLVMKGGESIAEMMEQIALLSGCIARQDGEAWIIAPPKGAEADAVVAKLFAQLAEEKFGSDAAPALAKIGEPAVPVLLTKLNAQTYEDDPYLYNSVAGILSRIPCAARDAAFLQELERHSATPPRFLYHWFGVAMVESLADTAYQPALPVLQKLAAKDPPDDVATAARIALGNMGAAPPPAPASSLLTVDPAVAAQLEQGNLSEAFDVLAAVVDSGFQPYGAPLEVTKLTVDSDGTTFSGNLRDEKGTWRVNLVKDGAGYDISASYNCGNLCGEGFIGKAEHKNDRWIIVEWRKSWVS